MILRYGRRLLMTLGLFSLLSFIVSGVLMLRTPSIGRHNILHVTLDGPLPEGRELEVSRLLGADARVPLGDLTERIRAAAHDDRIDGLLLDIKSPQVGLAQIEELGRAVHAFRATEKWTASFLETAGEGTRGDGAYLLAAMANQVILAPPGEINLMGMRTDTPFFKEALDRLQVGAHVEQRYEYKNYAEMFTQKGFTKAHRESLSSLLDDMQARMFELMSDWRHQDLNTVRGWMHEAPFDGAHALEAHLIDTVGYWDEVEAQATKAAQGREDSLLAIEDYQPKSPKGRSQHTIAVVVGEGEIDRGEGQHRPLGGKDHIGAETYAEALRQARADHVHGVLLRIDSPGGSYIASDLIRREIELTRDANIPVVISMGNMAASGGYMMAIAGDHIVAEPGTITGSIGVVSASFALREAMQRFLGVTFDSYASVDAPSATSFLDPLTGEGLSRMRANVDRIYQDFIHKVALSRHMTDDEVHAVAKGRVWTGRQALTRGLVDELGGTDTALAYLRRRLDVAPDAPLTLVDYPEPETPWTMIKALAEGQLGAAAALGEAAPALRLVGQAVRQQVSTQGVRAQLAPAPASARP